MRSRHQTASVGHMGPRVCLMLVTLVLTAAFQPSSVRAWTDADVISARAHVEVAQSGLARVSMVLRLQVRGGWLEGVEIADLDPNLVLDETKPPWVASLDEPDRKFHPRVRLLDGGRVHLSFPRRESPRRGQLEVGIVYTTDLSAQNIVPEDNGNLRIGWTLPGWRTGLDDVKIAMTVPAGATITEPEEASESDMAPELAVVHGADLSFVRWRRVHLPRTLPWSVAVSVPAGRMDPSLHPAETLIDSPTPSRSVRASDVDARLLWQPSTLLMMLILAALWLRSRTNERLGATRRPLLPLPARLRVVTILAATGAGVLLSSTPWAHMAALCLLTVLGLERTPAVELAPRKGSFRPANRADHRKARRWLWVHRLGLANPMDASTPVGIAVLGAVWAMVSLLRPLDSTLAIEIGALCVTVFATGTRHHLPMPAELRLLRLTRLSATLAAATDAPSRLELMVHEDDNGRWQDARLSVLAPDMPEALVRLDFALGQRADLGGYHSELALLAVTHSGSLADRALRSLDLPWHLAHGPEGKAARALTSDPIPALGPLLSALRSHARIQSELENADTIVDTAA